MAEQSFSSFVTGSSNTFAFSAAQNVANDPGAHYNPLFIHGGTSLGKTHLLHAIGHRVREKTPDASVIYTTAERIINEFVTCVFSKNMPAFRVKYRGCDVLLVDDVQYFGPEHEKSQSELFHAFNDLHAARKQIVLAADVPPAQMQGLEFRLRSRFEWGLTVDVQPPDQDLRIAILEAKAREEGVHLPPETAAFLAERCTRHVRQLEGCLRLMIAQHRLAGRALTLDLACSMFPQEVRALGSGPVAISTIQRKAAASLGVPLSDLIGKRRDREITLARHVAIYLCRKLTTASTTEIGRKFGARDHTTVLHAVKRIETGLGSDGDLKTLVARVEGQLR